MTNSKTTAQIDSIVERQDALAHRHFFKTLPKWQPSDDYTAADRLRDELDEFGPPTKQAPREILAFVLLERKLMKAGEGNDGNRVSTAKGAQQPIALRNRIRAIFDSGPSR